MEMIFDDKKVVGSVDVVVTITEEDVDDIMVGAIEGGINYWGYVTQDSKKGKPSDVATSQWCSRQLLDGKTVHFGDVEDDEEIFQLDLEKFINGCRIYATKWGNFDMDSMDAESYDCIIQCALFGKVVYG